MANISIALCTYFGEQFLEQQLNTLSEQTHPPFEVVICDDGSTDNTLSIIENWRKRCPFDVRVFRNKTRLGYAANFEQALGRCRGDWVAFCDQDDLWLPQKLSRIHGACHPQRGMLIHDAWIMQKESKTSLWQHCGLPRSQLEKKTGLQWILKANFAFGNTMVVRKDAIPIQAFPFFRSHDGWLAHLIALNHPLHFIDEPLICYRQHENQIMPNRMKKPSLGHKLNTLKHAYGVMVDEIEFLNQLSKRMGNHPLLAKKIKHLQQRVALNQRKGSLLSAIRDFRQGHYHHFSNGFRGLVKDMVARFT